MAKRKDYELKNYSKYSKNSSGFSQGTKSFFRLWRLANIAHNQNEAKRKRRRRELDRKIKENDKKSAEAREKNGPITANDILTTIIFIAIAGPLGVLFIDSIFENGLIETFKITFFIVIAVLIIAFIIYYVATGSSKESTKCPKLSEDEVEELQRQLENIEVYKNIVNTSTDAYAVKCAMDELIEIIDFIMSYDEEALHEAGMTKQKLPEQKQFIIDNYEVILKQIAEGTN